MESSADYPHMDLLLGHTYRFMMMSGEVFEGTITDQFGVYETFYVRHGQRNRQHYYWDVDYAWDLADD